MGQPKERMPFPVSLSSRPSSFRAQREIFLAQRSSGERQMRSSRSTQAILSLPHKYRVPLRRKRSRAPLGMMIREIAFLIFSFIPRRFQPPPHRGTSFHGKEGECRFPMKKTYDTRIPLSPYRHFERSEKSCLHTGKRESVR